MEIGCGARVRDFDGRRYWYFWHYERANGRSLRKEDYIGRVDSHEAREELLRKMAAYHQNAERDLARRRAQIERRMGLALRTSPERYAIIPRLGPRWPAAAGPL